MPVKLETWIAQATRHLSRSSAAQVRTEIQQHYESALEAALSAGSPPAAVEATAVEALGDPHAANRQYRRVLLTASEARVLGNANWEARALCSRPWLQGLVLAASLGMLFASFALDTSGDRETARILFAGGLFMALVSASPFLPIYTAPRARVFRVIKWIGLTLTIGLAFQWSWLFPLCLWPLAWTEWTRVSIRRKLPVSQWPKQLYL